MPIVSNHRSYEQGILSQPQSDSRIKMKWTFSNTKVVEGYRIHEHLLKKNTLDKEMYSVKYLR